MDFSVKLRVGEQFRFVGDYVGFSFSVDGRNLTSITKLSTNYGTGCWSTDINAEGIWNGEVKGWKVVGQNGHGDNMIPFTFRELHGGLEVRTAFSRWIFITIDPQPNSRSSDGRSPSHCQLTSAKSKATI